MAIRSSVIFRNLVVTKGEEDQVGWGGVLVEAVAVCLQSVFVQIIHMYMC